MTTEVPRLTTTQKRLVRDSFLSVQEYSTALIKLFYGRLFEIAPAVRPLFKPSLDEQSSRLLQMLALVVDSIDGFDEMRAPLLELGRKHVGYGAKPEHYDAVRIALLWALGQALGPEFDRETKSAWEQMLRSITATMLEGANSLPQA